MAIVKEAYSANRINLIYQLLKNEAENKQPKDYDVRIDELKVVSRTADPERFFDHEDFILADTKSVTINIYDGMSNRCTKYNLLLKDEPAKDGLAGIEQAVTTQIAQERSKWEYEQLKKDYQDKVEQLEEAEQYHRQLEQEIMQLKEDKNKSSNKLTETLVGLAGVYLSQNPKALSGIPLISGLFNNNNTMGQSPQTEDVEVTLEPVFEDQEDKPKRQFTGHVNGSDIEALELALIPFFKEEYLESIGEIIERLHKTERYIGYVLKGLQDAEKQPQTKQE